jgi:hypothetical protein
MNRLVCVLSLAAALAVSTVQALPFIGQRSADIQKACVCETVKPATVQPVQPVERIAGTSPITDTGSTVYTVLCLPRDYKSCQRCMEIKNAFDADADLKDVRRETRFWTYVEGDPDFDYRWQKLVPEVRQGKTVVILMQGNQLLAKYTAPVARELGGKLKEKLCHKFCPDCNKDKEPPEETPAPTTPAPLPETDHKPEAVKEANTGVGLALLGLLGLGVWGFMFRTRPS